MKMINYSPYSQMPRLKSIPWLIVSIFPCRAWQMLVRFDPGPWLLRINTPAAKMMQLLRLL
jgi:hypothetical protein